MKVAGKWILVIGILLFLAVVAMQAGGAIQIATVIVPATWVLIIIGGSLVLLGRRRERGELPPDER